MAAILFLVAILGLLFAGRTQAQAADSGSKPLFSFQLWQLCLALALPIVCAAAIPMIAKLIAVAATASAFAFAPDTRTIRTTCTFSQRSSGPSRAIESDM